MLKAKLFHSFVFGHLVEKFGPGSPMELCKKEGMPLKNTYICMKIRHIIQNFFHPIVGGGVEEVLALWFSN